MLDLLLHHLALIFHTTFFFGVPHVELSFVFRLSSGGSFPFILICLKPFSLVILCLCLRVVFVIQLI